MDLVLQRRRLRGQLRRLREARQLTQMAVAEELQWPRAKVIRIESGTVGISITDLRALLALYGVSDTGQRDALVAMARSARERPWWEGYTHAVPSAFGQALGYENAASVIRNFEPDLVPGLLQTEEYALEVLRWTSPPEVVENRAELRLERQERLLRADGPEMHFIVDEAVLARTVGGPEVMRRQLSRLQELAGHPKVTLRVVPFRLGLYPSFTTPCVLYEFDGPDEAMALYRETQAPHEGDVIVEGRTGPDEDVVALCLGSFFELESRAPAADTAAFLDAYAKQMQMMAEMQLPEAGRAGASERDLFPG